MVTSNLSEIGVFTPAAGIREVTLGCPVANGFAPCNHLCGGGWPGTNITHEKMLKALQMGQLVTESLACGPLQEQARYWDLLHSDN